MYWSALKWPQWMCVCANHLSYHIVKKINQEQSEHSDYRHKLIYHIWKWLAESGRRAFFSSANHFIRFSPLPFFTRQKYMTVIDPWVVYSLFVITIGFFYSSAKKKPTALKRESAIESESMCGREREREEEKNVSDRQHTLELKLNKCGRP